jgi:phosphatidylinositol 4-phosphatase
MIYKIITTEILPLRERQIHDPDEDKFLGLLKWFLKSGPMYFSYTIDLTNSFQRQAQADTSLPLWKRADDRFFYNRFIQDDLIGFRERQTRGFGGGPQGGAGIDPYILPVIFGMLEIAPTELKSTPLTLVLISRRSRFRGGTRYFSRGLDDEGHASNYNETEQIVILNDSGRTGLGGYAGGSDMQSGKLGEGAKDMQVLSYVQTRGSVPVYWAEINNLKYVPKLQIRGIESAYPAAKLHFDEQIRIYGDNYLVNLVNKKGREQRVKEAYEQMVQMLVSAPQEATQGDKKTDEKFHVIEPASAKSQYDRLHYVYFDFHSETKGMQMHRAQLLLDRIAEPLMAQGYFRAVDMPAATDGRLDVRATQTSVVRTNCMDCLDRTNVVQSLLARYMLNRMFGDLGVIPRGSTFHEQDPRFEFLFRNMWADNADIVSGAYAGTGAMKTDLTRLGKRTKQGALQDGNVAITRYCRNNFLDGPKQDAFDLFLGAYSPATANVGPNLVFADRRPVLIQAIPYLLGFSIFFVIVAMFTSRGPDSSVIAARVFILVWLVVAAWSANFIISNGMLYVSLCCNFRTIGVLRTDLCHTGYMAQTQSTPLRYGGLPGRHHQGAEEQARWTLRRGPRARS